MRETALAQRGETALAVSQVRITAYLHPFRAERTEAWGPAGQPVSSYLAALGMHHTRGVHIWLDDAPLPPAMWPHTKPKAGARLTCRVCTQGGNLLRAVLFLGIATAALAASAFTAGLAGGGVLGSLAGAGAGLAVGCSGHLAVYPEVRA